MYAIYDASIETVQKKTKKMNEINTSMHSLSSSSLCSCFVRWVKDDCTSIHSFSLIDIYFFFSHHHKSQKQKFSTLTTAFKIFAAVISPIVHQMRIFCTIWLTFFSSLDYSHSVFTLLYIFAQLTVVVASIKTCPFFFCFDSFSSF